LILLQIAVITGAAALCGRILRIIRQPPVVGEMLAGLLLGPSVLGWMAPPLSATIFPSASLPLLDTLGQVGIVMFMFLVGLQSRVEELRSHARPAIALSFSCMLVPLAAGALTGHWLFDTLAAPEARPLSFALFTATAMSITAFPVLARILHDQHLVDSRLGRVALYSAALGDTCAWVLLAGVLAFSGTPASTPAWVAAAGAAAYTLVVTVGVRRVLRRIFPGSGHAENGHVAAVAALAFLSAAVTDWLGVHAVFGAFLAGVICPKHERLVAAIHERMEPLTIAVFVPIFFASSGQRVDFRLLASGAQLGTLALIMLVAIISKAGPAYIVGRRSGFTRAESMALGALMNARGLIELVVLRIGLDQKLLSPAIFSMMVIMAILTTVVAPPVLAWTCTGVSVLKGRTPSRV
jgi:Kef-type K+ transport system membrane component KefB